MMERNTKLRVKINNRIRSGVELITPALAMNYLESAGKIRQRRLRTRKVSAYAQAMRDGKWVVSNDAVAFDAEGVLMNGQHRLNAVLEADVAVEMLVVRNLERRAYAVFDIPERRTAADYLHQWLPEEFNRQVHHLAALIRAILRYTKHGHFQSAGTWDVADHEELLQFALDNGDELHEILARTQRRGMKDLAATGTTLGALFWFISRVDADDASEFYGRLGSGAGLNHDDPIFVLRQTLVRYRMDPAMRPNQNHMAAIIIKAWNHWRDGEPINQLQWRGGGARPEPFPEPR